MGTSYHISIIPPKSGTTINFNKSHKKQQIILKQQIDSLLVDINKKMSTYQQDSEISLFNRYQKTTWFNVSEDLAFVVANAQEVSELTDGAFDITVSPFVDLWGFGSKVQYTLPTDNQLSEIFSYTGYQSLTIQKNSAAIKKENPRLKIDLSAIAKGFAVDIVASYLRKQGFNHFLVEIGGEIKAQGNNQKGEAWQVAIEQPEESHLLINKIISVYNTGLATSGDYRNYYIKDGARFSHTINPKTGKPITHKLASVTILHDSTMIADAYATAVMVMGEKQGKTFIIKNKLSANLIIRESDKFISWSNLL